MKTINSDIFTIRDKKEGKVGIGKLPKKFKNTLNGIKNEFENIIPNKSASTYHIWYKDMPISLKKKIDNLQLNNYWDKLCDNSTKCITININEMNELYYSNPKNNLDKINLYGASGNYDMHRDCIFNFDGIKCYRVLIGLTEGNNNITTYFNNLKTGTKINKGDYIVFDFDKTLHQVIKHKNIPTPRILLKLHYVICENCKYSKQYVKNISKIYIYYEYVTRYIMSVGTDPETFYQFFIGLFCQFYMSHYFKYILVLLIITIIFLIKYILKIKFKSKNLIKFTKYTLISLVSLYTLIVIVYWLRYKLFRIR